MSQLIEEHRSPDGLLTFSVKRGDDGIISLGFDGFDSKIEGDMLTALSNEQAAIRRFVDDLIGGRAIIAVARVAGEIRDVWVADKPVPDLDRSKNESIEFRSWSGGVIAHFQAEGDAPESDQAPPRSAAPQKLPLTRPTNWPPTYPGPTKGERLTTFILAWVVALNVTAPLAIQLLPLFPLGLFLLFYRPPGNESSSLAGLGWLVYFVQACLFFSVSSLKAYRIMRAILMVLLLINVAGCWRVLGELSRIH